MGLAMAIKDKRGAGGSQPAAALRLLSAAQGWAKESGSSRLLKLNVRSMIVITALHSSSQPELCSLQTVAI